MKLHHIIAIAAAIMIAIPTWSKKKVETCRKEVGIQLYSVRQPINDLLKAGKPMTTVLDTIAAMGYTAVETANYVDGKIYGMTPQEFRAETEKRGLKVLSAHTSKQLSKEQLASADFTEPLEWWKQCIADHKAAGCQYIVFPYMAVPATLTDLDTQCRYLNAIGALCAAEGIKFGYHNHSHEFTKVDNNVMYDYMLQHTDADCVFFQMDVYWAMMGHASQVEYFKRYPGRFRMLHIKDKLEVGQSGMVGFDAIFNNAATAGVENLVIEAEGSSYGDIMRTMRESINYLLEAPFVKPSYTGK